MRRLGLLLFSALAAFAASASALGAGERIAWSGEDRYRDESRPNIAGQFDYYALVLSWSPTYCSEDGEDDNQQCNRRDGRRYSFVLHGLWPQYERGYPEACRLPRRPFVPQPTINGMLDIMPSSRLVIHEYRAHGTCSGLDPNSYFSLARRVFQSIRIPDRFRNPFEPQLIEPDRLKDEFLNANPRIEASMIAVVCGGGRLKEVRICFGKDGSPRACGANENQRRLCSVDRVFVPPARSTARDGTDRAPSPPPAQNDSPLPGPRMPDPRQGT